MGFVGIIDDWENPADFFPQRFRRHDCLLHYRWRHHTACHDCNFPLPSVYTLLVAPSEQTSRNSNIHPWRILPSISVS